MASDNGDLEIIFHLKWKNCVPASKPTIVCGICDIPAITLNWDKFKSYIALNAGTASEYVNVYYVDSNERDVLIESQEDFQLALYSIRKRARNGEVNILKFEKVSFCKYIPKNQVAPDWFIRYMRKFKKDILEEVGNVMKSHSCRKSKSETMKMPPQLDFKNKDKFKSEKNFLDSKMEQLDYKTFKTVEAEEFVNAAPSIDETEFMNASIVSNDDFPIIHLMGGEAYMHTWNIINCGMLTWNENTVIKYSWGSQDLIPIERMMECPHLKPGEIGSLTTYYNVPETPGLYECYWHFHHKGSRFGKWLGLQVIVDDLCVARKKKNVKVESAVQIESNTIKTEDIPLEQKVPLRLNENDDSGMVEPEEQTEVDKPENADADSISIISMNGSNSSKDGYVMIYGNENGEQQEPAQAIKEDEKPEQQTPDTTHNNDEINVAEDVVSDYAFIYYNGEKYPLHKKYLKEDYFQQAEAAKPTEWIQPENAAVEIPPEEANNQGGLSNDPMIQSMLSSCENRLFIFPQQSPGFEVVQSTSQEPQLEEATNFVNITALQEDPQNVEFHSADEYEDQNKNIAGATSNSSFNLSGSDSVSNRSCSHHPHDSPRCCFKERSMSEGHQNMSHHEDYETEYPSYSSRQQNVVQGPENLLTGAALLASSAMSTARSMMDMVMQSGKWVNGHWVSENLNSKRESALAALSEMGFHDRDLNATLLARYNDDVCKVVSELIQ